MLLAFINATFIVGYCAAVAVVFAVSYFFSTITIRSRNKKTDHEK